MNKRQEVFSQIYDQYIDRIYRFIFLKVNSNEIAQDLCSETFLRGWRVFRENKKEIENPQAFLYQIARNLIIDHYRKKGRTEFVSTDSMAIADPSENLEEKSFLESDIKEVKLALNKIKNSYQEIIIWRYVDDLSISEISKILNKSEGAVRVMTHRALKNLREIIEEG